MTSRFLRLLEKELNKFSKVRSFKKKRTVSRNLILKAYIRIIGEYMFAEDKIKTNVISYSIINFLKIQGL